VDVTVDGPLAQLRAVHRLTTALHQADSPLAFYEEAVAAVVGLLGIDRASLLLFDPDGVMRFKAWRGLSREYRQAVEGHTPWSPDDVDAAPILVPDVDVDESLAGYRLLFRAEGIRALAFVPLVHRQRLVGKFMLYYRQPHVSTAEEVAAAEILAAHVALALERRRAEEELLRQQEHLQLALGAGEMGTWEWDMTAGTVSWSPTLEALHGLAPGSFSGTFEAFQADMHPEDRPRVVDTIRALLDTADNDTYTATYRIILPDGSLRWVSASGQLLRDAVGRPERLLGVCGDVTERERLLEAERASAARLASLQRVTSQLSRAVTVADVAAVVLGLALGELGARSGSLCLLDGNELDIVDAFGYPDEVMAHWRRFPLDAPLPASEAVRTGRAVFLCSPAERDERYPVFASSPVVGDDAFAMVPLADGEPFGCLVFGFPKPREFSADDERFYDTLAGQCAAALSRAGLYEQRERAREAAERSRDRLEFLAETSNVLAATLDDQETFRRLAEHLVPGLADWCAIYLLDEGRVVPVAIAHRDPTLAQFARDLVERYPVSVADPVGVGSVIRTAKPEILEPITEALLTAAARDPEHLALVRSLNLRAALAVPLVARGKVIGALALAHGPGRQLDDELVALAGEVATRAAIAIDNARLFQQRTEIARTLQASLLPPELPRVPGLELGARYVAGGAGVDVGGDFYDVFPLDDHRFVAVIGDVCGRGVAAATLARLSRHAIRSAAITTRRPAAILAHLNEILLRQDSGEGPEPRFCTALVTVIDPRPDGSVELSLAVGGHPLPLLCEAGGSVGPVGAAGTLLGVLGDLEVTESELVLRPGDALVCFTDGVTERRDARRFFGDDAFLATVGGSSGDADTVAGAVEAAVVSFADGGLTDDMAVLVLRAPPLSD
jgi:PAS domain S-box-containing protein